MVIFNKTTQWTEVTILDVRNPIKTGWQVIQHFCTWITEILQLGQVNTLEDYTVVPLLSHVQLFVTLWATLSFTIYLSLLKLMSMESVMPSNHLILCHPLLFLPSIFPSIRVFSNESALHIRWPKYWSFSFSISPFNEYSRLNSFRIDWFDLPGVQGTLKESCPAPQFESINSSALSLLYGPTLTSVHNYRKNHSFD